MTLLVPSRGRPRLRRAVRHLCEEYDFEIASSARIHGHVRDAILRLMGYTLGLLKALCAAIRGSRYFAATEQPGGSSAVDGAVKGYLPSCVQTVCSGVATLCSWPWAVATQWEACRIALQDNARLKEEVAKANAKLTSVEEKLAKSNARCAGIEEENSRLAKENVNLKKEPKKCKTLSKRPPYRSDPHKALVIKNNHILWEELTEYREKVETLEEEKTGLKGSLKLAADRIEEQSVRIGELEDERDAKERGDSKQLLEDNEAFATQLDKANATIKNMEAEIASVKQASENAQSGLQIQLETTTKDLEDTKAKLKDEKAKVDHLQTKLDAATISANDLQTQLDAETVRANTLRDDLKEQVEANLESLEENEATIANLKKKLGAASVPTSEAAVQTYEGSDEHLVANTNDVSGNDVEVEARFAVNESHTSAIDDLNSELESAKQALHITQTELAKSEKAVDEWKMYYEDEKQTRERNNVILANCDQARLAIKGAWEKSQDEVNRLRQELNVAWQQARQQEEQAVRHYNSEKKKKEIAERDREEAREKLSKAQKDLTSAQEHIGSLQRRIDSLEQRLRAPEPEPMDVDQTDNPVSAQEFEDLRRQVEVQTKSIEKLASKKKELSREVETLKEQNIKHKESTTHYQHQLDHYTKQSTEHIVKINSLMGDKAALEEQRAVDKKKIEELEDVINDVGIDNGVLASDILDFKAEIKDLNQEITILKNQADATRTMVDIYKAESEAKGVQHPSPQKKRSAKTELDQETKKPMTGSSANILQRPRPVPSQPQEPQSEPAQPTIEEPQDREMENSHVPEEDDAWNHFDQAGGQC